MGLREATQLSSLKKTGKVAYAALRKLTIVSARGTGLIGDYGTSICLLPTDYDTQQ